MMRSTWIFCIILSWVVCTFSVPVEVIYSGNGCECQRKLNYQVNVPKYPMPPKYMPNRYGYKIEAPPMHGKAKVSYTFDFSVDEPKPPCPTEAKKLNLVAKVDRITMHRPDCPYSYVASVSPASASGSCGCGQFGDARSNLRYVNARFINSRSPEATYPNSIIKIESPLLMASGLNRQLNREMSNVRRKRDLERLFFRPRRQDRFRSARFVKLYYKPLSEEIEKENSLNFNFFSDDANPLKRRTKKMFFPDFHSRIVKRDIKAEYDELEKERQEMDLTVPEIIQFLPETLQPNFTRGPCQLGCSNQFEMNEGQAEDEKIDGSDRNDDTETDEHTMNSTPPTDDKLDNSFMKRNVNSGAPVPYMTPEQSLSISPCAQRQLYATMRRAAERGKQKYSNGNGQMVLSRPIVVPDPMQSYSSPPLQYITKLEGQQNPILAAPNYEVQHVPSEALDRIISDMIYQRPDFVDANSNYGGPQFSSEGDQATQTIDLIKKLVNGRLGLLLEKPGPQNYV